MTDLCYIILIYWDLVKPTFRAFKHVVREDLISKYRLLIEKQNVDFELEPVR